MPGRPLALCAAVSLAACVPGAPVRERLAEATFPHPSAPLKVRFFHGAPEDGFWVQHGPDQDLLVSGGARLVVSSLGEVRASAWDEDLSRRNEPLTGGLAIPARLGGGFVFWTRTRVYRAREFTGALTPVATGLPAEVAIRGARAGLSAVLVITDAGPRELPRDGARLLPSREPGLVDTAVVSTQHALRLDAFGRAFHTADGGRTWSDLSLLAGPGTRQLSLGESDLWIDTWGGRFLVTPAGKIEPADTPNRYDSSRGFQTLWKASRLDSREGMPWGLHEASPLETVLTSGAAVGDGTAFGVVPGGVLRVDLATGKVREISTEWVSNGLSCQPMRAPDAVLFACVWERSIGYGGYVLRSVDGAPPELERAFSDDGSFVADDEGAIGYVGACRATARYIDPEDQSRYDNGPETSYRQVICVRRAPRDGSPAEWLEHRIDPGESANIVGWAPRLDGSAAAIVMSDDPLPAPVGDPRAVTDSGVRVVRVAKAIQGWSFRRAEWRGDRGGLTGYVDRRFHARDDGTIDGWLASSESYSQAMTGVTLDRAGVPAVHETAPGSEHVITGGGFAVAFGTGGDLYESTDHGKTWRLTGKAPAPPPAAYGASGCSALGCAMGSTARLGWGYSELVPRISTDPLPDPPASASLPRLVCSVPPGSVPVAMPAPPPAPAGAKQSVPTSWGDTLEIVRDAAAPEPPPPPGAPSPAAVAPPVPVPTASASASASARAPSKKPPSASPAVRRTHSLLVRLPFTVAPPRRLDATDASFHAERRALVSPLLAPSGEVEILVGGEQRELLVAGDKITVLPSFEGRRWSYGEGLAGLTLPGSHALLLGESRRRLSLEDHGPGAPAPPVFLGFDREQGRRRPVTLGRRDDGMLGLLVLDGPAPETVGIALLDRAASSPSPIARLAPWSTLLGADDPRCKKGADSGAFRALVVVDPSLWLSADAGSLPGVELGKQGLFLVRWGRERVCLEAMDASVSDRQRRGEGPRSWSLVARWGEGKERGAALRTSDLRQALTCRIEPRR